MTNPVQSGDLGSFSQAKIPTCAVVLLAALLAGCEATSSVSSDSASSITYFTDDRTGLCFAALGSQTHGGFKVVSITHVPCESERKATGETQ